MSDYECEYCADTRIDGLTLKYMKIELPCRYCEPTAMQPDRIEIGPDHILSELLGETLTGENEDV